MPKKFSSIQQSPLPLFMQSFNNLFKIFKENKKKYKDSAEKKHAEIQVEAINRIIQNINEILSILDEGKIPGLIDSASIGILLVNTFKNLEQLKKLSASHLFYKAINDNFNSAFAKCNKVTEHQVFKTKLKEELQKIPAKCFTEAAKLPGFDKQDFFARTDETIDHFQFTNYTPDEINLFKHYLKEKLDAHKTSFLVSHPLAYEFISGILPLLESLPADFADFVPFLNPDVFVLDLQQGALANFVPKSWQSQVTREEDGRFKYKKTTASGIEIIDLQEKYAERIQERTSKFLGALNNYLIDNENSIHARSELEKRKLFNDFFILESPEYSDVLKRINAVKVDLNLDTDTETIQEQIELIATIENDIDLMQQRQKDYAAKPFAELISVHKVLANRFKQISGDLDISYSKQPLPYQILNIDPEKEELALFPIIKKLNESLADLQDKIKEKKDFLQQQLVRNELQLHQIADTKYTAKIKDFLTSIRKPEEHRNLISTDTGIKDEEIILIDPLEDAKQAIKTVNDQRQIVLKQKVIANSFFQEINKAAVVQNKMLLDTSPLIERMVSNCYEQSWLEYNELISYLDSKDRFLADKEVNFRSQYEEKLMNSSNLSHLKARYESTKEEIRSTENEFLFLTMADEVNILSLSDNEQAPSLDTRKQSLTEQTESLLEEIKKDFPEGSDISTTRTLLKKTLEQENEEFLQVTPLYSALKHTIKLITKNGDIPFEQLDDQIPDYLKQNNHELKGFDLLLREIMSEQELKSWQELRQKEVPNEKVSLLHSLVIEHWCALHIRYQNIEFLEKKYSELESLSTSWDNFNKEAQAYETRQKAIEEKTLHLESLLRQKAILKQIISFLEMHQAINMQIEQSNNPEMADSDSVGDRDSNPDLNLDFNSDSNSKFSLILDDDSDFDLDLHSCSEPEIEIEIDNPNLFQSIDKQLKELEALQNKITDSINKHPDLAIYKDNNSNLASLLEESRRKFSDLVVPVFSDKLTTFTGFINKLNLQRDSIEKEISDLTLGTAKDLFDNYLDFANGMKFSFQQREDLKADSNLLTNTTSGLLIKIEEQFYELNQLSFSQFALKKEFLSKINSILQEIQANIQTQQHLVKQVLWKAEHSLSKEIIEEILKQLTTFVSNFPKGQLENLAPLLKQLQPHSAEEINQLNDIFKAYNILINESKLANRHIARQKFVDQMQAELNTSIQIKNKHFFSKDHGKVEFIMSLIQSLAAYEQTGNHDSIRILIAKRKLEFPKLQPLLNRLLVDLDKIEKTQVLLIQENSIDTMYSQLPDTTKELITRLQEKIDLLEESGNTRDDQINQTTAILATNLREKIQLFIIENHHKNPDDLKKSFDTFKEKFTTLLHSQDNILSGHTKLPNKLGFFSTAKRLVCVQNIEAVFSNSNGPG